MLTHSPLSDLDLQASRDGAPPAVLAAEMAWCLERFMTGRADNPTMRRAEQALVTWEAWLNGASIDLAAS